jgi:hypothetical protein
LGRQWPVLPPEALHAFAAHPEALAHLAGAGALLAGLYDATPQIFAEWFHAAMLPIQRSASI